MRGVIASTPYLNTAAPGHTEWRQRVRAYLEARTAAAVANDEDCGGVAEVRAHTRRGPNGPVDVAAHRRVINCG